jgi:hypothetical protein
MQNLGHADPVLEKLLQFADFNDNGEVRLVIPKKVTTYHPWHSEKHNLFGVYPITLTL